MLNYSTHLGWETHDFDSTLRNGASSLDLSVYDSRDAQEPPREGTNAAGVWIMYQNLPLIWEAETKDAFTSKTMACLPREGFLPCLRSSQLSHS